MREERKLMLETESRGPVLAAPGIRGLWSTPWRSSGKSHKMTVLKSKGMWREDFERKNWKLKDTTWMMAESIELTMSLTSFQEDMKKS